MRLTTCMYKYACVNGIFSLFQGFYCVLIAFKAVERPIFI